MAKSRQISVLELFVLAFVKTAEDKKDLNAIKELKKILDRKFMPMQQLMKTVHKVFGDQVQMKTDKRGSRKERLTLIGQIRSKLLEIAKDVKTTSRQGVPHDIIHKVLNNTVKLCSSPLKNPSKGRLENILLMLDIDH